MILYKIDPYEEDGKKAKWYVETGGNLTRKPLQYSCRGTVT